MSRPPLPAAAAALVLAVSACGAGDDSSHGSMAGDGTTSSSTLGAATGVDADVQFAQMMIPHHEQAVEMATLALENGTASEDVKALAPRSRLLRTPRSRQ